VSDHLRGDRRIGDYEILDEAGVGGMGVVYKARQRSLGRLVALKVIRDEIARTQEFRGRFSREGRLAASVDHPHVVSVYDVGEDDGYLFLVMQWVDGLDLKRLLDRTGPLSPARAVAIAGQLASALDAVHAVGLVHRDVKPANVLLRQVSGNDHAYLTDFGVAKPSEGTEHLTQTGLAVGTPGYLSPEQIRGRDPTPQSDLYALGCLVFEALTGQPPFRADNEIALYWAHANDPRPLASNVAPSLGARFDDFLATALAVDPERRFTSGREFAQALAAASDRQDLVPTQPSPPAGTATVISPKEPSPPREPPAPPGPPPGPPSATPPVPHQRTRTRNPLALILLGIVALAGIAVGALAAGGVFSSTASGTRTVTGVATTGTQTHQQTGSTATRPVIAGTSACGGDLSVGPNTSCGFAQNVEQAYLRSSGGDTNVTATSPATGLAYTMHCTSASPHVCTGGNNASVYFYSGPSGGSASGSSGQAHGNLSACDPNISAGQGTSCPFAENVFRAYAADYKANGEQSNDTITATSPVTHQAYPMNCTNDGVTVNCSGGNNAFATFSFHAVQVY
jgi:serine/threonine-protein kinase